ncbi:MAG: phosphotransferase [Bacteroidales bacterium]|nr:phosphotransferase [Bacteroidales bacterium]
MKTLLESDNWEQFGGGIQGDSFFCRTDPSVILKLYSENISRRYVEHEFNFSKSVREAGIKCPEAIRMVNYGERWGIVFQRVMNKKSFCRAAGESPELTPSLAVRLAGMARNLHSKTSEGTPFPGAVPFFKRILDENTLIDEGMRAKMQKAMDEIAMEDKNTLLHGDFHYGNAITDGKEDFFIDLGNLSFGNPKFDIAMFYLVTHYGTEEVLQHNFHLGISQAMTFWREFKKAYYGREIPDEELLGGLRNYLLVRALWIQRESGNAPYSRVLMDLFAREDLPAEDRTV